MGSRDPRIDTYIANSAAFARPILEHLRSTVHAACPDVEETMKWGMPHFMYEGMLCGMASFKAHCAFTFWKGRLLLGDAASDGAMGQFGRITKVSDLPPRRTIVALVRRAMQLNEEGVSRVPRATKRARPEASIPDYLRAALAKNRGARSTFERFSPSQRREYVEWVTGAKREETRERRLATMLEWLEEGKPMNWKYVKS